MNFAPPPLSPPGDSHNFSKKEIVSPLDLCYTMRNKRLGRGFGLCAFLKKGMLTVTNLAIGLLCGAGLFLTLLEDRFRLWATVSGYAAAWLLSLGAGWVVRGIAGPTWGLAAGLLVQLAASLFLSRNNPLQKFYLWCLALSVPCCLEAFLPPLLGLLPVSPAGVLAAVISWLAQLALAALLGLCFYHPFRLFRGRGPSAFLAVMSLVQLAICAVSAGKADFLFRIHVPAQRLFFCVLLLIAVIFVNRSVYQAGRYQKRAAEDAARAAFLELKAGDFSDTLANLREAKSARKEGEYALETVNVMIQDGNENLVPRYLAGFQKNTTLSPLFHTYHENPYLNAVIASKAIFASQNNVSFESNAVTDNVPFSTVELCVLFSEVLTKAVSQASAQAGDKRVHFTVSPGEGSLTLEAVLHGETSRKSWIFLERENPFQFTLLAL